MVACFAVSIFHLKLLKVRLLAALLFFSILVEVLAEIIGVKDGKHFFLYHFYNIIEYFFVVTLLAQTVPKVKTRLKKNMILSSIFFAAIALWVSFRVEDLSMFPSIGGDIESVALITCCLLALWQIEVYAQVPIYKRGDFWVILAFFLYFTGTFGFNSIYNTLLRNTKGLAQNLFTIINSFFNYILYIFLIIGILCIRAEERYLER